jgi:hypothetical protein
MNSSLLFSVQIDCEATQSSMKNPALGARSIRGLAEIFSETSTKGTFLVIPGDLEAHGSLYQDLEKAGHEVGLHLHPAELGASEFLGVEGPETQRRLLSEAMDRFAQVMGRKPKSFCPGYGSANDFTFGVLDELGFTHGMVSIPTRNLPQCACTWGGAPLDPHYAHRYNRVLAGDLRFVNLPPTVDPESRMWGGAHPQDLRVELVDAKNHWYTIDKAMKRQVAQNTPLKQIHALTHNTFEYGDRANFRRETCVGIIQGARQIAEREKLRFQPATLFEVAMAYREAVPHASAKPSDLKLDTRGRAFNRS